MFIPVETNLKGLGLALSARCLSDVKDASAYDMSSGNQTPREVEFIVFQNNMGHYAVARVVDVKARSHGDSYDALIAEYWINPDGSARFAE